MAKDLEKEELGLNQVAETMGELKSKIKSSAKAKKEAQAVIEEDVVDGVEEVVEKNETPKFKYKQPEFMKKLLDPENKDNIEFYNEEVIQEEIFDVIEDVTEEDISDEELKQLEDEISSKIQDENKELCGYEDDNEGGIIKKFINGLVKLVKTLFSAIIYVIKLPFKLIGGLFKRFKKEEQSSKHNE